MDVLTYSDTRARLKEVMDRVVEDHTPVVVTPQGGEARRHGLARRLERDGGNAAPPV
jgi:PHD/YefM family antitoxin component YafN of YafNO toxin-antitoxin module